MAEPGARRARAAIALAALAVLIAWPAAAQKAGPPLAGADLVTALRAGGLILYFRHADTDHRQTDVRGADARDCASQRNLTDRGRERSRAIGEAIRALGVPIGPVLASPMCRTVETAMLAFGAAEPALAALDPGPAPPGSPDRFQGLRALLSAPPPPATDTVIVGHAYPFYSLVGGQFLDEGQAAVVRPVAGGFEIVARVSLEDWRALAVAR